LCFTELLLLLLLFAASMEDRRNTGFWCGTPREVKPLEKADVNRKEITMYPKKIRWRGID
jgi:hypothetical protein